MTTVKSLCRVCTALCGILVDVSTDEVVRAEHSSDDDAMLERLMHHARSTLDDLASTGWGPHG